jgi:superfamily II DNA helicase RecQ
MQVRILTLPFSTARGGFDDGVLAELCRTEDVVAFREHVVWIQGQPYVACAVEYAPRQGSRAPSTAPKSYPAAPPLAASTSQPEGAPAAWSAEQRATFERIRAWRRSRAEAEGVPPYVLLTNRQLSALVERMPDSRSALGTIDGIGPAKVKRYGSDLLALVADKPLGDAGEDKQESLLATSGGDEQPAVPSS